MWDKEIPPEDQNNSSLTRLCRVSDEIVRGGKRWGSQQNSECNRSAWWSNHGEETETQVLFSCIPDKVFRDFHSFRIFPMIRGGVRRLWSCDYKLPVFKDIGQRQDKICIMVRIVNVSVTSKFVQSTQSPCCSFKQNNTFLECRRNNGPDHTVRVHL